MHCCARPAAAYTILALAITTVSAKQATIGLNFTGTSVNESNFHPPDTMGAVGPGHIVELVNGRYRVYSKQNGAILRDLSLDGFWNSGGVTPAGGFAFDPRVQYDPLANRYYATSVDAANNPNNILFAVSKSANPLDGWTAFSVDGDTDNQQWADFPQMGFNNDAVVIAADMIPLDNGQDFELNVLSIPKGPLLGNSPSISHATFIEDLFAGIGPNRSQQPAFDLDGSGRPIRFFSTGDAAHDAVSVAQLNDPLGTPSVVPIPAVTGLTPYGAPPLAQQPGPIDNLQSGGLRTRNGVKLIDDHYYGVHGVDVAGRVGQRWYKINADTLELVAEGVIADPDLDFIYGSIAANASGDIVIGFTGTGESQFPSSYAVVGETNPLSGGVSFDQPVLLKAGVANYQILDSSDRNRWGDYSATVMDPANPFVFWTFQEYTSSGNEWSIQISQITLNAPGDFDNNGVYNCVDIDALVTEIATNGSSLEFDLTGDGDVDLDDLQAWRVEAGFTNVDGIYAIGDINLDGTVNGGDFIIWNQNKFTAAASWCAGDVNADGLVDGRDFILWNQVFGDSLAPSVPEPVSQTVAALMFLWCVRWRAKRGA